MANKKKRTSKRDERLEALAKAGNRWAQARLEHEERERNLPEEEKRDRERFAAKINQAISIMTSPLKVSTIVDHLDSATELAREKVANGAFTPQAMRQIDEGVAALRTELRFARAMGGDDGFDA